MAIILLAILFTILELLLSSLFYPMPFRDSRGEMRYRTFPWMTWTIIILNILVFMVWLVPDMVAARTSILRSKVFLYGYREAELHQSQSIGALMTFTAIFMHGSFAHLFGNMLYLRVFGFRVEDACGPWRFLAYYLLAGMVANVFDVLLNPIEAQANFAGIGASGAISGVMGAYLIVVLWRTHHLFVGGGVAIAFYWGNSNTFVYTPPTRLVALAVADPIGAAVVPLFDYGNRALHQYY